MKSVALAALTAIGGLVGRGYDVFAGPAPSHARGYSFRPQSEASKKFHLDRAATKRARKGRELRRLADLGAIAYSPRQIMRNVMMQNGYSQKEADVAFEQMRTEPLRGDELAVSPATTAVGYTVNDDGNYTYANGKDLPKSELVLIAFERGVKVYASWTRQQIIDALNATL